MTDRHIWESISTAPKDGTLMFLDYGDGVLYIGGWYEDRWVKDAAVRSRDDGPYLDAPVKNLPWAVPLRWSDMPSAPLPYREEDEAA